MQPNLGSLRPDDNRYDLTYVTAYPKHAFLIDLLLAYGFKHTKTLAHGELMGRQ